MKRLLCLWLALVALFAAPALGEKEVEVRLFSPEDSQPTAPPRQQATTLPPLVVTQSETTPVPKPDGTAREELIDRMIGLAEQLYTKANGRAQRAASSGDIYVCKNFTVHLFRQFRDDYRMQAYPDVPLVIPNNLPAKQSKPYYYGIAWEDIPAEQGNPFYPAHSFYYDSQQSPEENRQRALDFMRQVQRGDFFQMSAQYYYGVGAHSLVFTKDYDPATNQVVWTDSNMKGESRGGVRYGWVQYDASKDIEWFVDAFCKRGRGATLYRLREDIIRR